VHEGRLDWQFNRHGIRLEPEEVERALLEQNGVALAAVREWDLAGTGEPELCAYIVFQGDKEDLERLKEDLRSRLPAHMIPSRFMLLPSLPLNRSGKIDRAALPPPLPAAPQVSFKAAALEHSASDEVLSVVARICAEFLRLPSLGSQENLLDHGLHSLVALQITTRLNQQFHVCLPASLPLQYPTVGALATAIADHIITDLIKVSGARDQDD
jgi:acyl carrier protein